jgi:hypothetical protein
MSTGAVSGTAMQHERIAFVAVFITYSLWAMVNAPSEEVSDADDRSSFYRKPSFSPQPAPRPSRPRLDAPTASSARSSENFRPERGQLSGEHLSGCGRMGAGIIGAEVDFGDAPTFSPGRLWLELRDLFAN